MTSHQKITIGSFSSAARAATGTVVVIDVFRAFTTAAVAFANGAEKILMVDDLEAAKTLRAAGAGRYCMGERGGLQPDGFDFGNSPAEIADHRFDGETVIQTTSNGTRGILAARGADRIYAGSFAIAEATVRALGGGPVALIAMGADDKVRREEDELCAIYLRSRLQGLQPDFAAMRRVIETSNIQVDTLSLSPEDVDACLKLDSQDFAIRVTPRPDGICEAVPER